MAACHVDHRLQVDEATQARETRDRGREAGRDATWRGVRVARPSAYTTTATYRHLEK